MVDAVEYGIYMHYFPHITVNICMHAIIRIPGFIIHEVKLGTSDQQQTVRQSR